MILRSGPAALPLVLLLLSSCSDDAKGGDEVGGPSTVIVDPGTGAENTEALWPLVVGSRRVHTAGVVAVPDRTQKFGKTLYRFQGTTTVRYYDKTDEGVFSAGSITLGALPREVLLVPAKVKVGMTWQSFETADTPSTTSVVKSASLEDTIFGKRMVWTLAQTDNVGMFTYTTKFAEGRGPIDTDGDAATLSIVPLDAEPTLTTPARLPLTPLGAGMPVFTDFWAQNLSAIVDANGNTTIRTGGITTWYENTTGSGSWQLAPQTACATTTDGTNVVAGKSWAATGQGSKAIDPSCPEASGALFGTSGLVQIDVSSDTTYADHTGLHLRTDGTPESFAVTFDQNQMNLPILGLGDNGQMYGIKARVWGGSIARSWTAAAGPFQRLLIDNTTPSDDFGFAAMFGDHVVGGTVAGLNLSPLELYAGAPGAHLSTRLTSAGREHYLVTADGKVDRMHIAADGRVTFERYAELELPAQHELVGVVPFADHLLVLAVAGRDENPVASLGKPALGSVLAFSAPLPAADPTPAMLPQNGITAEVLGHDLKVCWPRDAGAAITTGWTLGGDPVTAVSAGASGDCVVLLRKKGAPDLAPQGAYAAEGPIPGVGKVAIGVHSPMDYVPAGYGDTTRAAALVGGGFTSVDLRYGNAGDVIGVPGAPSPISLAEGATADSTGLGVWWSNTGGGRHICLMDSMGLILTGPVTHCVAMPYQGIPSFEVEGGGVVYTGNLGTIPQLVKPDGSVTALTGLPANAVLSGALADGTVCGVNGNMGSRVVFCSKAGLVTTAPITEQQHTFLQARWVPSGGMFYSLTDGTAPMRIDPATLTVVAIDHTALVTQGGYFQSRIASDGKLYVAHHPGTGVDVYAVEGTTLVAADPDGWADVAATVKDVIITEGLVIGFTGAAEPNAFVRFPRK